MVRQPGPSDGRMMQKKNSSSSLVTHEHAERFSDMVGDQLEISWKWLRFPT
jgi:hypothetical protein